MPKPKREPLTTDFKYLDTIGDALQVGAFGDIIREIVPEDLKNKFNAAVNTFCDDINPNDEEKMQEQVRTTDRSYALYGQLQTASSVLLPQTEEHEKKVMDDYSKLLGVLQEIHDHPSMKNYAGFQAIINHQLEIGKRALDEGRDISTELSRSRAGKYIQNIPFVDLVTEKKVGEQKVKTNLDTLNQALIDFHYKEISSLSLKQMDLQHEISDEPATPERKEEIKKELMQNNTDLMKESEHVRQNGDKVTIAFNDMLNVTGARGIKAPLFDNTMLQNDFIRSGMDPAIVPEMIAIAESFHTLNDIKKDVNKLLKIEHGDEKTPLPLVDGIKLQPLKEALDEFNGMNPANQQITSHADYVKYAQQFADKVNNLMEVLSEPGISTELYNVQQAIHMVDSKNPVFGTDAKGKEILQSDMGTSINTFCVSSDHNTDLSLLQMFRFMGERLDYRAHGITVNEKNEVVYSPEQPDKTIRAMPKLNELSKKIRQKARSIFDEDRINDLGINADKYKIDPVTKEKVLDPNFSHTFYHILTSGNALSALPKDQLCYTDITRNLNQMIGYAERYEEEMKRNTNPEVDLDMVKARLKFCKEVKKFAKNNIKEMKALKPDSLNIAKPYMIQEKDIERDKEFYQSQVSYLNTPAKVQEERVDCCMTMSSALAGTIMNSAMNVIPSYMNGQGIEKQGALMQMGSELPRNSKKANGDVDYNARYNGNAIFIKTPGFADTPRQYAAKRKLEQEIDKRYEEILGGKEYDAYPTTKKLFEASREIWNRSKKDGGKTFEIASSIPGFTLLFNNADFKMDLPGQTPEQNAKNIEGMFAGMKYDKAVDIFMKRLDLETKYQNRALSPQEKQLYSQELREINEAAIEVYEQMISPENEEKYSKFYQNFSDTVSGVRGLPREITQLKETNKMLINGWDPARAQDAKIIQGQLDVFKDYAATLSYQDNKDPRLNSLRTKLKKVQELDPKKQQFASTIEFDKYLHDYSQAAKSILNELKKPDVKAGLKVIDDALQADNDAYTKHVEELAKQRKKDPTIVVPREANSADYTKYHTAIFTTLEYPDRLRDEMKAAEFLDPTKPQLTGSEKALEERNNGLKYVSETIPKLESAAKSISYTGTKATEYLAEMENKTDKLKDQPSMEYMNMKLGLIQVSKMRQGDNSLESSKAALQSLVKSVDAYLKKNESFLMTNTNAARQEFAVKVKKFANKRLDALTKASEGLTPEQQKQSLSDINRSICGKLGVTETKGETIYRMRNNALDKFSDSFSKLTENLKQYTDFLTEDAASRKEEKKSPTYKAFEKAVKDFNGFADINEKNPEKAYKAAVDLMKAADAYAKDHSGITSGNYGKGKERYNASVSIANLLRKDLPGLAKEYYSLQPDANSKTINQLKQNNEQKINEYKPISKRAAYEANTHIAFRPKTWLNAIKDCTPDGKKPADPETQKLLERAITSNMARLIAAKQLENHPDLKGLNVQREFQFEEYAKNIEKTAPFIAMFTPPKGKSSWDHLMEMKNKALMNGGNELYGQFVSETIQISNQKNIPVVHNQNHSKELNVQKGPQL